MRLTQITPALPRSVKRKADTQLHLLQQRRLNPTRRRRSRTYQRLPHPLQDDEDTPEPVLMHLHGGQKGAAVL